MPFWSKRDNCSQIRTDANGQFVASRRFLLIEAKDENRPKPLIWKGWAGLDSNQ